MKSKSFSFLVIFCFVSALLLLTSITAITNIKYSPDWRNGEITGDEVIFREYKSRYMSQKNLNYDAYILGGSKAGFLRPEKFNELSGSHFYNYWTSVGLFGNYEPFCKYIINSQTGKVKEIVLHLSTYETSVYYDDCYIPISIQTSLSGKIKSQIIFFKEKYLNVSYFLSLLRFSKSNTLTVKQNGETNVNSSIWNLFTSDSNKYIEDYVLNTYDRGIKKLFEKQPHLRYCKKNIQALKRIKSICDEYNVKLTIVIGAHFISRTGSVFGDDFNNYLKNMISVTGSIWDFSGINNENMNPYNFFNDGHFWYFTGDKMIENIYAPVPNTTDMNAFGILLTNDNIDQYIESQQEKWLKLKAEYDATGTIKLFGKEDPSYLGPSLTE